jgi:hypothetical protein
MADLMGAYTSSAGNMYDLLLKQQADAAFGRTLQALSQNQPPQGQQGPPPQMPPQGGMPPQQGIGGLSAMSPPQGGPQAGPPGAPPGAPPPGMAPGQPPGGPPMMPPQRPPMPQGMPPGPQPGGGQPGMPQPQMPPQQAPMGGQMPPQGMPPMGGQPQGGAPQLDWRTVLQKVQQANPGAPPAVLAGAVDRFTPLMNQQAQQQWKEISMQMRETSLNMQEQRLRDSETRMAAGPGGAQGQDDIKAIAKGIEDGDQPPVLTGLYGKSAAVRAQLEKDGVPLAKMQQEWARAQKLIMSLNGPQQVRFLQLADSVQNTISRVKQLADQMQQSGFTPLNKLELEAKINTAGNTPQGKLATDYVTAVGTLKEEFANLANGGYAPTEAAWALANKQINENYGVGQLNESLNEINRLIGYRVQGAQSIGGGNLGPNAPNRYTGQGGGINSVTGEPQDKSGFSTDGDQAAPKGKSGVGNFDRAAAKKAGYTDKEIDDYLKGQ